MFTGLECSLCMFSPEIYTTDEQMILRHPALDWHCKMSRSGFVGNRVSVTRGSTVTLHLKPGLKDRHLMWALMLTRLP